MGGKTLGMSHFDWPQKKNSKHWGHPKIESNWVASKLETEGGASMGHNGHIFTDTVCGRGFRSQLMAVEGGRSLHEDGLT